MTKIVNIYKSSYDVYIGRAGKGNDGYFGNPYQVGSDREECVRKFKDYFYSRVAEDEDFRNRVDQLKDKTLGCFCFPKLCHGMVYIEYLDGISIEDQLKNIEK